MSTTPPPPQVIDAFGLTGDVVPTNTRDVWRVGSVALKWVRQRAGVEWVSELLRDTPAPPYVRLPAPIAATDGRWVVEGWAASRWIAGTEDGSRWREILQAADGFHDWLSGLERPNWLDETDDPWRAADRMAWGEQPIDVLPGFARLVERLELMLRPLDAASQLVHGDLTGNVLFADGLVPGVIDLTLYWRPPGYAAAIVAVDCFEWEGVGDEVLDYAGAMPDGEQLLVRAAMFRIVRAGMVNWIDAEDQLRVHRRTVAAIESRLS